MLGKYIKSRTKKIKKIVKYINKNIQKLYTQYQDEAKVMSNTNIRK